MLDKGEKVIPNSLFSKYFQLTNSVRAVDFSSTIDVNDRKRDQRLDKFVSQHDAGVNVQVVNVDQGSEPEERLIPLLFKPVSRKPGAKWVPIEMLNSGEYVQVNGVNYKWVEYVEKFVIPRMKKTVSNLKNLHKHPFAMIIPGPNGNAVAPLLRNKQPQTVSEQAFMLASLAEFVNNFSKSSSTDAYRIAFNNRIAGFDINKKIQPDWFTNISSNGKPFLGLTFTATELNLDEEFFNENQNSIRVLADINVLSEATNVIENFFKRKGLKVDISTEEGIQDMFNQLDALLKYSSEDEDVEDLQEDIAELYKKFTNSLYKAMSKKIDSLLNNEDPEIRNTTERLVTDKKSYMNMIFDVENRKPVLKIVNRSLRLNDLQSYSTIKATYRNKLNLQFNMSSIVESSAILDEIAEVQENIKTSEPILKQESKPITPNQTLPNGGIELEDDLDIFDGAFSLGNALENAIFAEGEYKRQVDYIRERLPKDIAIDDLEKIVRHRT